MSALRFDVSTCRHRAEPILRPRLEGLDQEAWLRWLHTDLVQACRSAFRERLSTVAEPPAPPAPVVPLRPGRKPSDVREQKRWAA